jgi:hypothetical protein
MLGSIGVMHRIIVPILHGLFSSFRTRMELQLEVATFRHQVEVLRRDRRSRVRLTRLDRALWVLLYRLWSRCLNAVVIVKPETVVRWHRLGFRAFWSWKWAGHPGATLRLESVIASGPAAIDVVHLVTDLVGTLLPSMERLGVVAASEVALPSLAQRILAEIGADGTVVGRAEVAAWVTL